MLGTLAPEPSSCGTLKQEPAGPRVRCRRPKWPTSPETSPLACRPSLIAAARAGSWRFAVGAEVSRQRGQSKDWRRAERAPAWPARASSPPGPLAS
jgi:hypothetical protein